MKSMNEWVDGMNGWIGRLLARMKRSIVVKTGWEWEVTQAGRSCFNACCFCFLVLCLFFNMLFAFAFACLLAFFCLYVFLFFFFFLFLLRIGVFFIFIFYFIYYYFNFTFYFTLTHSRLVGWVGWVELVGSDSGWVSEWVSGMIVRLKSNDELNWCNCNCTGNRTRSLGFFFLKVWNMWWVGGGGGLYCNEWILRSTSKKVRYSHSTALRCTVLVIYTMKS